MRAIVLLISLTIVNGFAYGGEVLNVVGKKVFLIPEKAERFPVGMVVPVLSVEGDKKGEIQILNSRGNTIESSLLSGDAERGDIVEGNMQTFNERFEESENLELAERIKRQKRFRVTWAPSFTGFDGGMDIRISDSIALGLVYETYDFKNSSNDIKYTHQAYGASIFFGQVGAFVSGWLARGRVMQISTEVKAAALGFIDKDDEAVAVEDTTNHLYASLDLGYQWAWTAFSLGLYAGYGYSELPKQSGTSSFGDNFQEGNFRTGLLGSWMF